MDVELLEIQDFLAQVTPLNNLTKVQLQSLSQQLKIQYARRDSVVLELGGENDQLCLIRKGALDVINKHGDLITRCAEGEFFGFYSLIMNCSIKHRVTAIEDSLIYCIPKHIFQQLLNDHFFIKDFFHNALEQRMHKALDVKEENSKPVTTQLLSHKLSELIDRQAICAPAEMQVFEAAILMTEQGVSSLLVISDNASTPGHLLGVVTDSDLRKRVIAERQSLEQPIRNIMTRTPTTINSDDYAFEAMMIMLKSNIHHLPIVNGPLPVGMVTVGDLIRLESESSVYLVSDIYKKNSVEQLAILSHSLKKLFVSLEEAHTRAENITHVITSVNDAITCRLIELAEQDLQEKGLGLAPIKYAWVALGSQAREEQTIHSDQDNALILSDDYQPELHAEYFLQLAKFVNHGLDACGYVYCPGEIMASNTKWRQPLKQWLKQFSAWIKTPDPQALLQVGIFFDMRCITGDKSLCDKLHQFIEKEVPKHSIFLAHMANNALSFKPPLGFFRKFVLEHDGSHDNTINFKSRGIAPIVDATRVYALAAGISEANTLKRLEKLSLLDGAEQKISAKNCINMQEAYELIAMIRINHQSNQLRAEQPATNYLNPKILSSLERGHLRDAFKVAADQQKSLAHQFNTNAIQ